MRGVPLLHFDGGPGVPLLNFEGGPGFRVPEPRVLGPWGSGPTFTPSHCRMAEAQMLVGC